MKTIKIAIGIMLLALLAVSCIPKQESMGTAGQTLIKLMPDGGFLAYALKMQDTPQTANLLDVRKNSASDAALKKTTTVVLQYDADTAILNKYNNDNGTDFIPLPDTLYTLSPAISNGEISLTFNGEAQKSVMITIPNILRFDFSKKYAMAFAIKSISGEGKLDAAYADTVVLQVMAANMVDGKYEVTGTFVDYVYDAGGTAYTSNYPTAVDLITTGLYTVTRVDHNYGYYYIFNTNSAFGNFCPGFRFDDAGNITDCFNTIYDPPTRSRTCYLYTGVGSINKFNAADHSIDVTWGMVQQTVTPKQRSLMTEHYAYKGPR